MAAFMLIINIVIVLVAIVLIVSVLMQQGNRAGLGAIGGGAETFFGKAKARSYEGKLEMITKISAAVFTVLVIVLAATYNRYGTGTTTVTPVATATTAAETVVPEETAEAAVTEAPAATEAAPTAEALATEAPAATPAA